jgi:hypothetical protein
MDRGGAAFLRPVILPRCLPGTGKVFKGRQMETAAPTRSLRFADLVFYTLAMTLSIRWIAVAAAAGPGSLIL